VSKTSKTYSLNQKLAMKKKFMTKSLSKSWNIFRTNYRRRAEKTVSSAFIVIDEEEVKDQEEDKQLNWFPTYQMNGLTSWKEKLKLIISPCHSTKECSNWRSSSKSKWSKSRRPWILNGIWVHRKINLMQTLRQLK